MTNAKQGIYFPTTVLCLIHPTPQIFAGVEGGGTTWRVALAVNEPTNIVEQEEFPTTTPTETLGKITAWLRGRRYDSLGIGTFGPVDLNPHSKTFGYITSTPKPGED